MYGAGGANAPSYVSSAVQQRMDKLTGGKLGGAGYAGFAEKPPTAPGAEKEKFSYTKFIGDASVMEKSGKKLQSTPSSTHSKSHKEGSSSTMSPREGGLPEEKDI